jgi:misacylated tRNA(Ala) deacylase
MSDSYLKEFDSQIRETRDQEILLDSTVFYPGGGGQPQDRGKLNAGAVTLSVVEVRKEGDEIFHKVKEPLENLPLQVHGVLDWDMRYAHMRHHTALHILSGVVYHQFGSLVTGGQIYSDRARLDFDLEDLNPDRLAKIENEANNVVQEARPVNVRFFSRDEAINIDALLRTKINLIPPNVKQIRVVDIEGFDAQADGGTHVRNTKEVGRIRITKTQNKGKMNRRIEIALDMLPGLTT